MTASPLQLQESDKQRGFLSALPGLTDAQLKEARNALSELETRFGEMWHVERMWKTRTRLTFCSVIAGTVYTHYRLHKHRCCGFVIQYVPTWDIFRTYACWLLYIKFECARAGFVFWVWVSCFDITNMKYSNNFTKYPSVFPCLHEPCKMFLNRDYTHKNFWLFCKKGFIYSIDEFIAFLKIKEFIKSRSSKTPFEYFKYFSLHLTEYTACLLLWLMSEQDIIMCAERYSDCI